jgi:hypothetical protein
MVVVLESECKFRFRLSQRYEQSHVDRCSRFQPIHHVLCYNICPKISPAIPVDPGDICTCNSIENDFDSVAAVGQLFREEIGGTRKCGMLLPILRL